MKYHTALKFIAILLCAAALLGAVASGAGIAVLTAGDLYDRTVEEFYSEEVRHLGTAYAENITAKYAGQSLGGCPSDMMDQRFGTWFPFQYNTYNYRLLDAEGNELVSEHRTDEAVTTYRFPVTGKYMYLVNRMPWEEKYPRNETDTWENQYTEDIPEDTIHLDIYLDTEPTLAPEGAPMMMSADAPQETVSPEGASVEADTAEQAAAPAETAVPEETIAADEAAVPAETAAAPADTSGPAVGSTPAAPPETMGPPTDSVPGQVVSINGRPLTDFEVHSTEYYDYSLDQQMYAEFVFLDMPEMTLELELAHGALGIDAVLPLLVSVRNVRSQLLPMLAVCLLVFAILAVYLCCAAGHKPKTEEIKAGGLNRIPLELYGGALIGAGALFVLFTVEGVVVLLQRDLAVGCGIYAGFAYLMCLLVVGFCFALAAQLKTPGWFWARNSLCGLSLRLLVWLWHKFIAALLWSAKMLEHKIFPFLGRALTFLWNRVILAFLKAVFGCIGKCWRFIREKTDRFLSLLPLTWQWLVTGFAMVLLLAMLCATRSVFGVFLGILITIGIVLIGSSHFGTLLDATKRMSRGDLNARIDESRLFGCFRDFARNLNALANVAVVAAQKQLKSERMKTELITNVSHDIKTPLTSIINYVDLLQKPHSPKEEEKYLEVLSRQSQQLKKLIEDLIEMSKASTGNMSVDIIRLDAVEAVNQALGEFADKLEKAQLTPIFRHSEEAAPMMADGKLTWRVLHNLLSNAVKYALPGTRLYIDLMALEGKVILSVKNVSREQLNVDAEELMERFVRGDDSRNTEGSGLGLNIAKSLMELQKGSLQLLVDGDLFKVTLIFPGCDGQ